MQSAFFLRRFTTIVNLASPAALWVYYFINDAIFVEKGIHRGELSYLAPLGSENISAPYFKQCFFRGGGITPPDWVKHHASQSQDRNNKYFILYIEFCINNKI